MRYHSRDTEEHSGSPLLFFGFCLASDRSVRQSPSVTLRALDEDQHHGQLLAPGGRHESSEPEGGSRKEVKHSSGSGQRAGSPGRWGRQLCLIPLNGWAGKKKEGGKGDLSVRWKIASGEKEGGWWSFKKSLLVKDDRLRGMRFYFSYSFPSSNSL